MMSLSYAECQLCRVSVTLSVSYAECQLCRVYFMPSVIYAECYIQSLYAECHYDECHYADCRGTVVLGDDSVKHPSLLQLKHVFRRSP
jgi:hypothetical protein